MEVVEHRFWAMRLGWSRKVSRTASRPRWPIVILPIRPVAVPDRTTQALSLGQTGSLPGITGCSGHRRGDLLADPIAGGVRPFQTVVQQP
jgi:hypothetical protein